MYKIFFIFYFFIFSYATAAPEKIRVVGSWSYLTMFSEFEKPYWKKKIQKEFPNLTIRVSSIDQVELSGISIYKKLTEGKFDVASVVNGYILSDSQILAGLDLPTIAPNIKLAKKIVKAYYPIVEKALIKDFNSKLLGIKPYPSQILFCNNKITSLLDLKNKKVRAGNWPLVEYLKELGASGVIIPFNEISFALKKGTLDCAIAGSLSGYFSGWGKISKYLYPISIGGWAYVITAMNLDTWNKFTKKEQEKILSSYNNVVKNVWEKSNFESIEGINCLTGKDCSYGKSNNMELVKVKSEDRIISKKIIEKRILKKWIEKVPIEIVEEWNESVGKIVNIKAN